jgi:hypothetical protein
VQLARDVAEEAASRGHQRRVGLARCVHIASGHHAKSLPDAAHGIHTRLAITDQGVLQEAVALGRIGAFRRVDACRCIAFGHRLLRGLLRTCRCVCLRQSLGVLSVARRVCRPQRSLKLL